ncbi:MAG: putative Rossmann fold flavoprotein [Glaciecola sp.]|jgi:predicted Rossmann fold flavoprotein
MLEVKVDVLIIGAGAAGLLCASRAGARGKKTIVVDHAKRPGKKILISGGGRCNFTNYNIEPEKFICKNPHFCKSALSQYTQWDFIALVEKYNIAYHEKTLGQLFCDDSAKDIVSMLMSECKSNNIDFSFQTDVVKVSKTETGYSVETNKGNIDCESLVIASGGLSMPKLGATPIAYKIAEQFGLNVLPTRAGLVPLTLPLELKEQLAETSGVSMDVEVTSNNVSFNEGMLITHRGLSGPAILQVSSYWESGDEVSIDLDPQNLFKSSFENILPEESNQTLKNFLANNFAKKFVEKFLNIRNLPNIPLKQLSHKEKELLVSSIKNWTIKPSGSEGYRTAEVTIGGVDTDQLSSKTMEVKDHNGLFFIGEAVDVTGWLGGYNFQWAWSSGFVAGSNV